MEYYHKAAEALRSGEEYPLHVLKQAGLTAIGGGVATAASGALGRILPAVGALINQYVPDNIAKAGLTKIDPRFGNFVKGAMDAGYTFDEVRQFLGDKLQKSQEQAKTDKSIIEQYDPELHTYIKDKLKSGMNLLEAGKKALGHGRFRKAIEKMTKDNKVDWSTILDNVFGGSMKSTPETEQMQQSISQIQPQPQQASQQMQQAPQQAQGGIDPQLAQLLQQGNALLQKIKGG